MATNSHTILGGKVNLYKRGDSDHWHCATFLKGKNHRKSTKEDSLSLAKEIAEDWYLVLRGKDRAGLLKTEKTFAKAAEQFLKEYEIITEGQRSPRWVEGHGIRLRLHLIPYFGELGVSEITPGKVQEYRMHRATTPPEGSLRKIKTPTDKAVVQGTFAQHAARRDRHAPAGFENRHPPRVAGLLAGSVPALPDAGKDCASSVVQSRRIQATL